MADLFALLRLVAAVAVAGAIAYGIYRGLRWRFPRLHARRAALIVTLGVIVLASLSANLLRTGNAECLQHENSVLLFGERVIRIDDDRAARPAPAIGSEPYLRVAESCRFMALHCPLDAADETRSRADAICLKADAGAPLD